MSNSAHPLCPDFRGINALTVVRSSWCMRVLFLCLVISVELTGSEVSAQVVQNTMWQNTIGSYQEDIASDALILLDGRVLVYGTSNSSLGYDKSAPAKTYGFDDYWVVMLDSTGTRLWDGVYGGDGDDKLKSVIPLADGGYLLAGMSRSGAGYDRTEANLGSGDDYWVLRIDSTGEILWDNAYGGSEWDQLYKAIETDDNGFLLIGWSRSYAGFDKSEDPIGVEWTRDYWIVKLDAAGNIEWENTIGGTNYDEAYDGVQTADGGYLILGVSNSNAGFDKSVSQHGLPGIPTDDYWLVKLNADGDVMWDKTMGGTENDVPDGMLDCGDDTYLLFGYSYSYAAYEKTEPGRGYGDYWILKVDDAGNILWDKTIGSTQSDRATAAVRLGVDYYLIGGTSWSDAGYDKTAASNGESDYWIVGIDGSGAVQWDDAIGCDEEEGLNAMLVYPDASVLIVGSSISDTCWDKSEMNKGGATNDEDFYILRRHAYEFYILADSVFACFDSTYTLPWGDTVDTYGMYFDTIPGDFLDTLYTFTLIEQIIDDSLIIYPGYAYVNDCIPGIYTWFDCDSGDTLVSGEYYCYFDVYYDGNYAVAIEYGECSVVSDCTFMEGWINIENIESSYMHIYPNPATNFLYINNLPVGAAVQILDGNGRRLLYERVTDENYVMDVSHLSNGLFTVLVLWQDQHLSGNFVKY